MRRFVSRRAGTSLLPAILTMVSMLCVFLLPAFAGEPPVPIEGKMLVCGWDVSAGGGDFAYFMEGSSDNILLAPPIFVDGTMSPHADQVAYVVEVLGDEPYPFCLYLSDISKADIDGSNPVDVTGPLGPGGINCNPRWSPDASMITFQHCDPPGPGEEGLMPCERGFEVWVINSDGADPHRVTPEGLLGWEISPHWSPNGYRILFEAPGSGAFTIDIDGNDLQAVPNVGGGADWSPDGSHIVSSIIWDDVVNDEPGVWRQLVLSKADGSDPQVLVERFVTDADVQTHLDSLGPLDPPDIDWFGDVRWWVGPLAPEWSPLGDRIVFTAAMPFNPSGPHYNAQADLWVYELGTGDLTKITDDPLTEGWVTWDGDNTFPYDPEVTVDNTTVTFSAVTGDGLTTVIRDDDPPALPADYQFCGEYYNVSTTADYTPPITICMTYEDEDVPGGDEAALCLLHYNETTEEYEDITTSKDTEANIVCGEVDSLSVFGLSVMPIFGGFRPPINADGTSEWKAGRTIPVKFAIADPVGSPITNAICHLSVAGPLLEAVGDGVLETAEAASADVGDTFRYDEEGGQYIYNLSTKGWAPGAYLLEVSVEGWPGFTPSVRIGLR
ncbi:MAG TPA: PxKF domain-containing protein [Armatimonadota bacterium]|nr:PxKF domain-containing protein [Armatimonadota bacterium]